MTIVYSHIDSARNRTHFKGKDQFECMDWMKTQREAGDMTNYYLKYIRRCP